MKQTEHTQLSDLALVWKATEMLSPYVGNPRQHSEKQIAQIAKSIEEFGFNNPILLDGSDGVIAGHGRLEAAKFLGLETVPTLCLPHMSEEQKRAYIIADNKLAENATWDTQLLKLELEYLSEIDPAFDLTILGFEAPEIDYILQIGTEELHADDQIPDMPRAAITQPGYLWVLEDHKLYCGDSRETASYEVLLGKERAHLIFTDPPYNVPVKGHVCGNGAIQHREFAMASGEMSSDEFKGFLEEIFKKLIHYSSDGSIHFICMDWRHISEIVAAGAAYTELKNLCVWNKNNGGMGSLYRSKHELIFVFKNGQKPHINNVELGKNGRHRTNVWDYAGINSFQTQDELALHPTVKPVALIQDAILDCSCRGHIVLDVFGGSGSTILAAENSGRKARVIEIDPAYVDVAIERWQLKTGKKAKLSDGSSYDELKKEAEDEQ